MRAHGSTLNSWYFLHRGRRRSCTRTGLGAVFDLGFGERIRGKVPVHGVSQTHGRWKERTAYHVLICHLPKLTLSKLRWAVICLWW